MTRDRAAGSRRALYAAGLLAALVGTLLAAWFASGWADVRARQRAVLDAPRLAAEARGVELALQLRSEFATLMSREVERPYSHYQNAFRGPRASPLASERDPLVLGYFQLDATGRTSTPTINDDAPELSEPTRLAENRRFRDEVARSVAGPLAPRRDEVAADAPIAITVSPLGWKTVAFAGQPAMVAVRRVDTPDGRLAQGFVVDRATLTSWLASRAGDAVADLRTGDNPATEIVPGWHIEIAPNPLAVTAAAGEAAAVARGFVARFVALGALAILAAFLVVVLVARG